MPKPDANETPPHDDGCGPEYEEEEAGNKNVKSECGCTEVSAVSKNIRW
jgi:hypothetical protein